NVLIKMADPVFLGYHAGSKAEISLKVVKKRHAEEKVGIVGYIDGHLHIIEYSELSQEDMYARNGDGALKYNAGNIAVHVMDIDFLERIYQIVNALPYHAALKKVSCLNEKGDMVNPEKNNAVKFESFIFDILRYVKQGIVMEVLREEEFSPVKNSEGNDSPATAKRDIVNLFGRWLRNTGISIPTDPQGNDQQSFLLY
ncbi:UTP--glucose-1-phosphate uridylyltransferase, partial [Candidatus Jettenia sp. AMX1]|uniref:UTP--glucose-1-phosphate uridylyltransferase n=1 Tax=Candidatus Jettenia sp. AMX1 TaxID=2293637 RepID=UPI0025546897